MTAEKNVASDTETSSLDAGAVKAQYADTTLELVEQYGSTVNELTPKKLRILKNKLYLHILVLLVIINLMLFIDKSTLSQASLLGILEDTGMGNSEYNNLNTIFYTGYIVGQIPGQLLIQRLPVRVYVSGSIFVWAVIVLLHCPANSYGGLIPLRFLLGVTESTMVPALEITMTMFFTPPELHQIQPLFWTSCVASPIPAGLLAYGLLFSKSDVSPWKFFMIVTGGLTLLLSILSAFVYPSNPATAWFLTTEEKVHTIQRVHEATRSSIEQKRFKKHQLYEALHDPISWLFTIATFCLMLANNLAFQLSLLYLDLGVSNLGSTLVWVAAGGFALVVCVVAAVLLRQFPGYSAYWAGLWCLPAIAGSIGMVTLSWDKTIPLLACLLLATNTWGMTYIISLGWTTSSCAGHTKKLTRNAMFMAAYGISNIISPQLWKSGGPRYYATWIVQILISFTLTPLILILIRWLLSRRNKVRREWIAEQHARGNFGEGYIEQTTESGEIVKTKVDISMLDLTDLENKFFIYPL
ncbi:Sucrose/H+ symporter, plant [Pleurostoma richardsiae]|uniref:Sucrose/H+ symporter, plant n=1 Tax=Pleurostoma richardsiae TaxID=41990 RepID=A0AA38VL48_9PEZI|nr:Sucrose/H+ symporter, plant [Pleurostoma richardsiae]